VEAMTLLDAIGGWLLAIGHWQLAVGGWVLVIKYINNEKF